jgi:hypothetical protein
MSSVLQAKQAIKTLIDGWAWPTTAPVFSWGAPTEGEDLPKTGELIYFDGVEVTESHVSFGTGRLDEAYSVRVVIDVRLEGDDEQAAEARGWVLHDEFVKLLEQHHNLIEQAGVLNVRLENRRSRQANTPSAPQQWLSRFVVDQDCVGIVYNP